MTSIQQYLNPFYRPQELGAAYGWYALTHLTEKASKIQNVALRSMALAFAFLIDATLGFGLVSSLSYNSGALLYNSYGKVKHFTQKYRGIEESPWNKTALKTWAFIGTTSALVATLYYFGAFGFMKQGIGASQLSTATSSPLPSVSNFFPGTSNPVPEVGKNRFFSFSSMVCLGGGALLTGIGARIGYLYSLLPNLPKYDPTDHEKYFTDINEGNGKTHPNYNKKCRRAIEFTIAKLDENRSKFGCVEPWSYRFSNSQIRFLPEFVNQCRNRFFAELKSRNAELADKRRKEEDFWPEDINHALIQSANEWMRASYTLGCLALEDLETYAKNTHRSVEAALSDPFSPPLHFCVTALKNYQMLWLLDKVKINLALTFYGKNTIQRSWLEWHNDLCTRLESKPGMKELARKNKAFADLIKCDQNSDYEEFAKNTEHFNTRLPPKSSFSDWFFSRGPWAKV